MSVPTTTSDASPVSNATVSALAAVAPTNDAKQQSSNPTIARRRMRECGEYPMSSSRFCGAAHQDAPAKRLNVAHRATGLDHAQHFALSQQRQRDKSATNAVAATCARTDRQSAPMDDKQQRLETMTSPERGGVHGSVGRCWTPAVTGDAAGLPR